MSLNQNEHITTEVFVDTQYPQEKIKFHWRIENFSKIFNSVYTDISTASNATTWQFRLSPQNLWKERQIYLSKQFDGPSIKVDCQAAVKALARIIESRSMHTFEEKGEEFSILFLVPKAFYDYDSGTPLQLENDVLYFQCTMTVLGHSISRKNKSTSMVNSRSEKICNDLGNLLRSNQHNDVVLSDGQNNIPAHKAILCARSPVFNIMFLQNMLESEKNTVVIEDIDFETVKLFLFFLYMGKVEQLSWEKAVKLYYAGDKYEVQDLKDFCSESLRLNLSVDNACTILILAHIHNDTVLKNEVRFFISMHASAVKSTEGWREIEILSSDHNRILQLVCFILKCKLQIER